MPEEILIKNRRAEVESLISKLSAEISSLQSELQELDTAQRVLDRLRGAKRAESGATDRKSAPVAPEDTIQAMIRALDSSIGASNFSPETTTDAILSVIRRYAEKLGKAIAPKTVTRELEAKGQRADGAYVSSIMWRLWKRGDLEKVGSGLYTIPKIENPEGEVSGQDAPSGLFPNQQDREAGPGGGT